MAKMLKRIYTFFVLVLFAALFAACIYDFSPEELNFKQEDMSLMVIEGDIIPGDYTYIKVYKSVPLDYVGEMNYISNANVWVENESGQKWLGTWSADEYVVNTTMLDLAGKYKLCVIVPGEGEYESELMPVKISPEIDSLTFSIAADSTELYVEVTTHNDNVKPLYCKWSYVADWEFKAYHIPVIDYSRQTGKMYDLSEEEKQQRHYCWGHEVSSDVYIGSAAELTENLLYKQRLDIIHYQDKKLNYLYSTLVTQTVLDKKAYDYWSNVRQSSSQMGGIFSPQPTQVDGNIVNRSNPSEKVIGFVNVSTATSKRLYITSLEAKIHDPNPNGDCNTVLYDINYWESVCYGAGLKPVNYNRTIGGGIDYYNAFWSPDYCTDCRLLGSKEKPSYWPNDHK